MRVPVKFKRLAHFNGVLPAYQTPGASGFDVCASIDGELTVKPGERCLVPTGLAFEIPEGHEIQVRPRSGLAIKSGITLVNTPGTIDSDYRGELKIILINHGQANFTIKSGDRIAQLVLAPVVKADLLEETQLTETARGAGGFGSTGIRDQSRT
jgi:dUTP pyrophosphatase